MKKAALIGIILLVAVISTACINNFAVRDLNNKAMNYMAKGDYSQAIERLKSSLDLDSSVFETHYNLAIAYTKAEDYKNAVNEYKKALEIKPNDADTYYSLATAENNLAVDMIQGRVRMDINDNLYTAKAEDVNFDEKYVPSEKEQAFIDELKEATIQTYQKYLELKPDAVEKEEIERLIERIQNPDEVKTEAEE
jgi:tetratricopeptide (TPR) repeat protein